MSWQDWFRKELAQMSDHANDQKAKKDEKDDLKHQILIEDLGSQEAEALSIEELLDALLAISQDEIEEKSGKSFNELYVFSYSVYSSVQRHRSLPCSTEGERASITQSIVDTQLGEDAFDALSDDLTSGKCPPGNLVGLARISPNLAFFGPNCLDCLDCLALDPPAKLPPTCRQFGLLCEKSSAHSRPNTLGFPSLAHSIA
jgi:hypothetical protein